MNTKHQWVVCFKARGRLHENGTKTTFDTHFSKNAVGLLREVQNNTAIVWLIGSNETWSIPADEYKPLNVHKTGDKYDDKICNICHCLKPIKEFSLNQTNKHGTIRRPSCRHCRTDIDKRAPKTSQARLMEKKRPQEGDYFRCPICRKRSIVGITARIVADHDHHTGNIRDFICDSCNTGLGRFKNGKDYLMNAVNYLKKEN